MKPVLYNPGGYVAHLALKIQAADSFDAFVQAANLAKEHEGLIERLYEDTKGGSRYGVGAVERSGVILELGTFLEREQEYKELDKLRDIRLKLQQERANLKGGKGAEALDRLILLAGTEDP